MSTPGLETGLEKTFGIAISSSNANDDTFGSYARRYDTDQHPRRRRGIDADARPTDKDDRPARSRP